MFNKDLILTRKLEIKTWHVQGSIAKAQDRKDMMLVLKYLDEFPDSTAKDLSMHLFFDNNARLVVAIRLLELSNSYGLTNSDGGHGAKYSLTDKGQDALTNKEVFIPEDGCWKLAVSNDPLLPHIIINIEAFSEPNAFSEIIGSTAEDVS